MKVTLGMIVEINGPLESNKYKVKVRVPTIHGPVHESDYPSGITDYDSIYTKDEDLPWASVVFPLGSKKEDLNNLLHVNEIVYVLFPEDRFYEFPLVLGTLGMDYSPS